jgi:hypothetical protein
MPPRTTDLQAPYGLSNQQPTRAASYWVSNDLGDGVIIGIAWDSEREEKWITERRGDWRDGFR